MTRILVFGTFDILHPGHLWFLKQAKRHGDELVVVVTRDACVKLQKKQASLQNERDRLALVGALKMVDRAVLGDPPGRWTIIKKFKPDVICVGYDQSENHPALEKLKKKPIIIQLKAYHENLYSSSKIRKFVKDSLFVN